MHFLYVLYIFVVAVLTYINAYPITYEHVRGTPYKVGYDHRAITINGVRTMLISGAMHYPRSTPGMWPYLMKMAKNHGLNTIQTYVFWNIHEQKQGVLDFSGRANLSRFLEEAANAGLFVNLRIGPYVCAEWNYGGMPAWLNQIPDIKFRLTNDPWKTLMRKFMLNILDYVQPYLAKNGGPIILAQVENEYRWSDTAYVDWCGSLVTNEFASTEIPWIMCNGYSANSTIETCNGCNCLQDHWIDNHRQQYPNQPLMLTENEGWFQQWGHAIRIRTPADIGLSVGEFFAGGGAYHAYYMWHGGNNYARTAAAAITTMYADDVCLHSDGTPNEPKYTHLSRLQHFIADHAEVLLSQDSSRVRVPYWNGQTWVNGSKQFAYSYSPSIHFVSNEGGESLNLLFLNQNITMSAETIRIYDDNLNILWDSSNYSDVSSNNTQIVPIISGPLKWQTWTESNPKDLPKINSLKPMEQLNVTNDETIYLWYRYNVTLNETLAQTIVTVQTRVANALLFYLDGQYLGTYDNYDRGMNYVQADVPLNLSNYRPNQEYLFEILSISLGLASSVQPGRIDYKGIVGNVWLNGQLLIDNKTYTHFWEHQKGLIGEYYQIYTEQGSTKVDWNPEWTSGINKTITWFQTRFDLDHLVQNDTNANPILLDAQGLNRGHAYMNGNDLGLYWLIQGQCQDQPCCCLQAQIHCLEPTQRYYHIPSDWLLPKNNLLTVFDDSGAPSPSSVNIVQRVIN